MFPRLGFGLGLRPTHYPDVLAEAPRVDWWEVISENFMVAGGNPRRVLRQVRERWPVVFHGVSLSIGSVDPLDQDYLTRLATLVAEVEPAIVSDQLCWTRFGAVREVTRIRAGFDVTDPWLARPYRAFNYLIGDRA